MYVHLNEEELQAVIDFNESMAADAIDSCEFEEAEQRKSRVRALKVYLKAKMSQ